MSRTPRGDGDQPLIVAVNGFAVASIVIGVAAIITAFIPLIGVAIGGLLAIAGIVCGVIGRRRAADESDPTRQNMGLATGGLVASALALVVVILQVVGLVTLTDLTVGEFTERIDSLGNYVPGIEPSE